MAGTVHSISVRSDNAAQHYTTITMSAPAWPPECITLSSPHKTQWSASLTMGGVKVRADTRDEAAPGFVAAYLHHITMGAQLQVQVHTGA